MNRNNVPNRRHNRCPLIPNIFSTEMALLLPVSLQHYLGSRHDISCAVVDELPEFHPAGDIDHQLSLMKKALQYQKQSQPQQTSFGKNSKPKNKNSDDQDIPQNQPIIGQQFIPEKERTLEKKLFEDKGDNGEKGSKGESFIDDAQFMREIERLVKGKH